MRVSIESLRRWLLAGASLLVLVIAGFLGYAHYRSHRFLMELPRKLGADIRQETNTFTWSQTVKGRTVFTVHAAKAIQHKNGKYTMRDVEITVYGRDEDEAKRVDHISGKEFELDQSTGVVRAMGEVHLDLQAPAKKQETAEGKTGPDDQSARLIHVKTSGLVYLQKLGVAATDEPIEFEYNGLTGHATGADYNADTGVLVLHSEVKVSGLEQGRPILLTCSHAELDRASRKALLTQAKYVTVDAEGEGKKVRQTVESQRTIVFMRQNGSVERLVGEDGVVVTTGDGSQLKAPHGDVWLSEDNRPQSLSMTGGVHYTVEDESRSAAGEAEQAQVAFDGQGHAQKAVLKGAVHLNERLQQAGTAKATSQRELTAATVEMAFVTDRGGRSWMRDARASGGARLKVADAGGSRREERTSSMQGNVLTANFAFVEGRPRPIQVHGEGATALEQASADGVVQTSSGDSLDVKFRRSPVPGGATQDMDRNAIQSAVQQGHVVLTRKSPSRGGQYESDKVTAANVMYDGDTERATLSGTVAMQSSDGMLWADRVVVDQKTGDAAAEGAVKASYRQAGKGESLHVLSQRADLKKASDTAIFYGTGGRPARLWQAGSQIEAPVLEFERRQGRLTARGASEKAPAAVHTVLVSTGSGENGAPRSVTSDALRRPAVVRIASGEMVYSEEEHTAEFTGGVKVESADGVMRGRRATAYLQPATAAARKMASPVESDFLGGAVERVVVSGSIEIEQSGRRAIGDHLIYTAADGTFVLTGTDAQPPRVLDATRGTITGRELQFREQDASVVISNGDANGTGQRVRTETRVKRER